MFFGGMHFPIGHVLTTRTIFYHLAVFTISPNAYSVLLCSHPVKPSAGLEHSGMNSHSLRGSKHPIYHKVNAVCGRKNGGFRARRDRLRQIVVGNFALPFPSGVAVLST